jgi:hypothetical protein
MSETPIYIETTSAPIVRAIPDLADRNESTQSAETEGSHRIQNGNNNNKYFHWVTISSAELRPCQRITIDMCSGHSYLSSFVFNLKTEFTVCQDV